MHFKTIGDEWLEVQMNALSFDSSWISGGEEEEEDNDLEEDSDGDSIKDPITRRRYSYTQEHKLAAIEYL